MKSKLIMSAHRVSDNPGIDHVLLPDRPLSTPSKPLQIRVISCLWGKRSTDYDLCQFSWYFRYFASECEAWRLSGNTVALHQYHDLLALVEYLKAHPTEPRATLESHMLATQPLDTEPESVRNALYLAVRLWLMLNVGPPHLTIFQCRSTLDWVEDQSLFSMIAATFPQARTMPTSVRWQRSLNACSLTRVGGFEVVWTDHLADHLYLNEDLGTISLYHHAFVLQQYLVGEAYG